MKLRSKFTVGFGSVAALATAAAIGFGAGTAQSQQPHMQNALGYLQSARSELQQAMADKGGHRVAAINLVNQAITQVQAGIAVGAGM